MQIEKTTELSRRERFCIILFFICYSCYQIDFLLVNKNNLYINKKVQQQAPKSMQGVDSIGAKKNNKTKQIEKTENPPAPYTHLQPNQVKKYNKEMHLSTLYTLHQAHRLPKNDILILFTEKPS